MRARTMARDYRGPIRWPFGITRRSGVGGMLGSELERSLAT